MKPKLIILLASVLLWSLPTPRAQATNRPMLTFELLAADADLVAALEPVERLPAADLLFETGNADYQAYTTRFRVYWVVKGPTLTKAGPAKGESSRDTSTQEPAAKDTPREITVLHFDYVRESRRPAGGQGHREPGTHAGNRPREIPL